MSGPLAGAGTGSVYLAFYSCALFVSAHYNQLLFCFSIGTSPRPQLFSHVLQVLAGAGGGIKCKNDVINAFDWLGAGPRPVAQIEIVLWRASVNQTVKQRCHGAAGEQLHSCRAAEHCRGHCSAVLCRAGNEPSRRSILGPTSGFTIKKHSKKKAFSGHCKPSRTSVDSCTLYCRGCCSRLQCPLSRPQATGKSLFPRSGLTGDTWCSWCGTRIFLHNTAPSPGP